jgi:hypothetical protein
VKETEQNNLRKHPYKHQTQSGSRCWEPEPEVERRKEKEAGGKLLVSAGSLPRLGAA